MTRYDLLIIDPQNDFLDIQGAALPVPGAAADMDRRAKWLLLNHYSIDSITVTLDSHASVGIERTTFWVDAEGSEVPAFTLITASDVEKGVFKPRWTNRFDEAVGYLRSLEASGKNRLIAWPVHCVTGTWGHNIVAALSSAIAVWEMQTGKACVKILKGTNPMTEQYSAFRAEVQRDDDPSTHLNVPLLKRLAQSQGRLIVAGEAQSHCVAASVRDMVKNLSASRLNHTILLADCMSPVTGFEAMGATFMEEASAAGIRCMTTNELA